MIKPLFLTFIVLASVLNNQFIIDLDNEDRIISKYLQDLEVMPEYGTPENSTPTNVKFIKTSTNTQTDFKWTNPGLSLTIPKLEILDDNKDPKSLDYSLTVYDCQYCSSYDYITEKSVNNASINCIYKHGDFALTKRKATEIEKQDLKNFIVGDYNIRLVKNGEKVIIEKNDSEAVDLSELVKDLHDISKVRIHDMFLFIDFDTYFLSLISSDELILFSFKFDKEENKIKFKFEEQILLNKLGNIKTKDIIQIMFIYKTKFFIFINNGFYIFTKNGNFWDHRLVSSLGETELKNINVYAYMFDKSLYAFISVKGVGLIGVDLLDNNRNFMFLEHKHILGIQTHQRNGDYTKYNVFNLGLLIDNTADAEVNEFFVELAIYTGNPGRYLLRRAFISSREIKAAHTDYDNSVTAFLTDDVMYIIPRGHYFVKSLPVYFFDSGLKRSQSDFIFYRKGDVFKFLVTDLNNSDKDYYEFSQSEAQSPSYECVFQNKGDYIVRMTDYYLFEDQAMKRQDRNVNVKDNGWVMIMVFVIIGIVALILFIVTVKYCIKRKRANSGISHQALV
jgi:hypothetical protein